MKKQESRIIPEKTNPKFLAQELKPYDYISAGLPGKAVLEIGCGDGYGALYLAKKAARVFAVDYEKEIIFRAKDKYPCANLEFLCMDATELGFKDESIDIICSFQCIEHIPEDKLHDYLAGIKRILKKTGKFYLSTLNLEHNMKSALTYEKNPAHCKEFKLAELERLLLQVFPNSRFMGLHLTLKHNLFQMLKKSGIMRSLPKSLNPVNKFYELVTTDDFEVNSKNLKRSIDFICICEKS